MLGHGLCSLPRFIAVTHAGRILALRRDCSRRGLQPRVPSRFADMNWRKHQEASIRKQASGSKHQEAKVLVAASKHEMMR